MKRASFLIVPAFVLLLAAGPALAARPAALSVSIDHGETVKLAAPAASVLIANPDIADIQILSPTQVMIFGKRTGETTFMATDGKGNTLAQRTIVVTQDLAALREEIDAAIPGNRIKAKAVPGGIILTGEAKDAAAVNDAFKIAQRYMPSGGDIINRVQVNGSNQIQIRVRFAEVQRSVDNSLGINWQNLGSAGSFTFGLASGSSAVGSGSTLISSRPSNTSLNLSNNVLGATYSSGGTTIDGVIDALAQEGLITILAEPNLTAMSGETANFLAGGEFPIPIPQGNGTISITFKPYGVSLAFTPTLIGNNRINLHVRPEVSELTDTGSIVIDNITVPALTTRKAETTVEVASGQSFAVAGLLNNTQTQTINKFPILGDLPILGALFRSDHYKNGQTELVVIITPYIVKPSGERLALPTDGMAPPTEIERYIGLRTTGSDPMARPISGDPTAIAAPTMPVAAVGLGEEAPALQPVAALPAPKASMAPVAEKAAAPVVLYPKGESKETGGLVVE
jgi:pilus assembly protein CpaC